MYLPPKIKILNEDWKVKVVDQEAWGLCDYNNTTITLFEGLTDERKIETLLHEIIHVLVYKLYLKPLLGANEERVVDNLGVGLRTVFKDNNKLKECLF
jgi:hypothetical protein